MGLKFSIECHKFPLCPQHRALHLEANHPLCAARRFPADLAMKAGWVSLPSGQCRGLISNRPGGVARPAGGRQVTASGQKRPLPPRGVIRGGEGSQSRSRGCRTRSWSANPSFHCWENTLARRIMPAHNGQSPAVAGDEAACRGPEARSRRRPWRRCWTSQK